MEKAAAKAPERRRGEALVQAIHDAALAELAEVGLGGLSMEGIARRASTAKTVLYRRWATPHELLVDAVARAHPVEVPTPEADDLRADLIAALTVLTDWMRTPAATAVLAIVSERHRYPDLAESLYRDVFDPRGGTFTTTVLRHYAANGRLDPRRLTPITTQIGEAMVFKLSMDLGRVPTPDELVAIVDEALLPALGFPPA
ncbi:TetR/AcrR family transcriptional regulator [Saccharothrix luteola]|uniref:TetR/AcrR family transcriptional regulator n=1 Tax=Saccharothrix luteola TaxID=2893018 RepID=UPI001E3D3949|nr:TetR/AcrR family transcriptional regulator [Saccharothrix luteola]MCC8243334.1 TetR/AcrR family transcriptional regulator [Saccharothrix luteola]